MPGPTITIELDQFDEMRAQRTQHQAEITKLQNELADLKMHAGGEDDASVAYKIASLLRHALKVVQFAQGNCDPETTRGWPHKDLAALACGILADLPTVTDQEKEWATDALHYARTAAVIERARKLGIQGELAKIPRSTLSSEEYAEKADALVDAAAAQPQNG